MNSLSRFEPQPGQHQGYVIDDLYARADNLHDLLSRRVSSVDGAEPWQILANARIHLCGGKESMHSRYSHMDRADVQSWYLMADLQESLIELKVEGCSASITTNPTGEEAFECGKPVVGDTGFCTNHQEG